MAKRDKNQKLIEKIDFLLEKLEAETNPFKRALYTIKLEHLHLRLQKEINIINIKERFEQERQERIESLNERRKERTLDKMNNILNRNTYAAILNQNSDFDPASPNFAFQDELENMAGGDINKLIEELRKIGRDQIADRILEAVNTRKEYEQAKEKIEEMKNEGKRTQKEVKKENIKSSIKENALIVKEKTNIFKRIFNSIKAGINEYKKTKEANKLYEEEKANIQAKITGRKNREIDAVNAQYNVELAKIQALIDELNASRDKVISKINEKYNDQLSEQIDNKTNFRIELRNEEAANRVNDIVEEFNSKQTEQQQEESEQEVEQQEEPEQE